MPISFLRSLQTFAALTDISPPGELAVMIGRSSALMPVSALVLNPCFSEEKHVYPWVVSGDDRPVK